MNYRHAVTAAATLGATLVPFIGDTYTAATGSRILALGLLAVAVHYLSSSTGLASLGHGAYFGAGGYATIWLSSTGHHNAVVQLSAAALAGAVTAAVTSAALIRLRGLTYVLASLATGLIAATWAGTATSATGGTDGATAAPAALWPDAVTLANNGLRYLWVLAVTAAACAVLAWHTRSPFAAALIAVGDRELRLRSLGYPVGKLLLRAHTHSGLLAGAAGALWVHATGYLNPTDLGLATSAIALAAATIGHQHGALIVIAATGVLVAARDTAASFLPPAGQGPLWLGLLMLAIAFLPLAHRPPRQEARP